LLALSLSAVGSHAFGQTGVYMGTPSENITINGEHYITQLRLRVDRWYGRVKKKPDSMFFHVKLGLALYSLAVYEDDLVQVDKAINHIGHAISLMSKKKHPNRLAHLLLLRANMQTTLHRFEQALTDIKSVKELTNEDLSTLFYADINWNLGEYNSAEKIIRDISKRKPSMQSLSRLAILEYQLGNYQKAEIVFTKAREYDDKSNPITSSWLDVQMGIADLRIGRYPQAENHFRKAHRKVPSYILAIEHLAESLTKQHKMDEAIALYNRIIHLSDNPEYKVALSEIYKQIKQPQKAGKLIEKSRLQYESLLVKFPEAMYRHAADFYLSHGDKKRALNLLHKNLELRPNSDSYIALSKAQHVSGDLTSAKNSLISAFHMPPTSPDLCDLAKKLDVLQSVIGAFKPKCVDGALSTTLSINAL